MILVGVTQDTTNRGIEGHCTVDFPQYTSQETQALVEAQLRRAFQEIAANQEASDGHGCTCPVMSEDLVA